MVESYAAGEGSEEGGEPRAFVSVNWLLSEEPLDLETELVRSVWARVWGGRWGEGAGRAARLLRTSPTHHATLSFHSPQALGFLNYLMLGTSASPLRKALNDSGLGESLVGGGLEDELRQPVFSVGLKVRCLRRTRACGRLGRGGRVGG